MNDSREQDATPTDASAPLASLDDRSPAARLPSADELLRRVVARRWRLMDLFVVTLLFAAGFWLCRWEPLFGLPGVAVLLAYWVRRADDDQPQTRSLFAAVAFALAIAILSIAQATKTSSETKLDDARRSLAPVRSALAQYFAAQGTLPPATTFRHGVAFRSWRVDVSPFLGEDRLWNAYRRDEPWNSIANAPLAMTIRHARNWQEQFPFAVVGADSQWPPETLAYFAQASSGTTNTTPTPNTSAQTTPILFLLLPEPQTLWTQPLDAGPGFLTPERLTYRGLQVDGLTVMFADGACDFLTIEQLRRRAPQLFP